MRFPKQVNDGLTCIRRYKNSNNTSLKNHIYSNLYLRKEPQNVYA
ncbi:hypothetical protein HMPREF0322_03707 [Desulfitobacterium hafniense DP7]|uniref:Uncharacterized protein n=1 Tax=Desulfitobacterium hafniense DP7 TaxID=537010 RepID=G9XRV9_DESHA|nr:hypothetical protein HMPREF0322_03707 [Desulfitobacterium hafniense DP7]